MIVRIFVIALVCFIALIYAQDAATADGGSPNGPTVATNVAMDRVKHVASKAVDAVQKSADRMTVQVEKITHPDAYQPSQSNIIRSAARGIAQYSANVSVAATRAIGTTLSAGAGFLRNFTKVTGETLRRAGNRLYRGRKLAVVVPQADDRQQEAEPAAADGSGGLEPNELQKME